MAGIRLHKMAKVGDVAIEIGGDMESFGRPSNVKQFCIREEAMGMIKTIRQERPGAGGDGIEGLVADDAVLSHVKSDGRREPEAWGHVQILLGVRKETADTGEQTGSGRQFGDPMQQDP